MRRDPTTVRHASHCHTRELLHIIPVLTRIRPTPPFTHVTRIRPAHTPSGANCVSELYRYHPADRIHKHVCIMMLAPPRGEKPAGYTRNAPPPPIGADCVSELNRYHSWQVYHPEEAQDSSTRLSHDDSESAPRSQKSVLDGGGGGSEKKIGYGVGSAVAKKSRISPITVPVHLRLKYDDYRLPISSKRVNRHTGSQIIRQSSLPTYVNKMG